MALKKLAIAMLICSFFLIAAGCAEMNKNAEKLNTVKASLSIEQRNISYLINAFFSHLLRLEIDKANLLIAKTSPMRFTTQDHVRWNDDVGKNESKKQEIRDVLNDSKYLHYLSETYFSIFYHAKCI